MSEKTVHFYNKSGDNGKARSKLWFDPINKPTFIGINSPHRYASGGAGVCRAVCYTSTNSQQAEVDSNVPENIPEEPFQV